MLDEERKYFDDSLGSWKEKYAGKVALVKGRSLVGVFDTKNDALAEGARLFQLGPFLVRRVQEMQPVEGPSGFIYRSQ